MTIQGYYPLSKNAKDYSGSGNDGTASGYTFNNGTAANLTYTDNSTGIGKVATFGSTSSVTIPSAIVPNSDITTVQIRFASTRDVAADILFMDFAAGSRGEFKLAHGTTTNPLLYLNNSCYQYFGGLDAYLDGEEHILTLIVNPGAVRSSKLYVDGTLMSNGSGSSGEAAVTLDQLKIGTTYGGDASKLRIWNHELTLSEILIEETSLSPVKGEGLTGRWDLNGDTNDTNNLIKGQGGEAHRFNGVGTKISSSITTSGSAGTVMAWVYRTSSTTQGIVYDNSYHPLLYFSSGKLQAHYSGASFNGGSSYSGQFTATLDAWHHVGFTWVSSGAYALYSDGVVVDSGTITGTANGSGTVNLGYYGSNFLSGAMYDSKVLDYAETAENMARITSLGRGITSVTDNGNLQSYEMNETGHIPLEMDYTLWEDGQVNGVGQFSYYSSGNSRVIAPDPWGKDTVVWLTSNSTDPTYLSQGGIYYTSTAIDNTKKYRFTYWERRVDNNSATYGRYYFGCNAYGSVNGVVNLGGGYNTNPYFWSANHSSTPVSDGEWFLVVGFIHEHTYSGSNDDDNGVYTLADGKLTNTTDYKWAPESTTGRSRTLSIYRGSAADMIHHTVYPRMDIVDGNEPSINALLAGFDSNNIDLVRDKGGANDIAFTPMKDQATTNQFIEEPFIDGLKILYPFNGNAIDYSGNSNDGTVTGASLTTNHLGDTDKAYVMNGDTADTIVSTYNLDMAKTFTLAFWVKVNTYDTVSHTFSDKFNTYGSGKVMLEMRDTRTLNFRYGAGGGYGSTGQINGGISTGTWTHLIWVHHAAEVIDSKNGHTYEVFRNGVTQVGPKRWEGYRYDEFVPTYDPLKTDTSVFIIGDSAANQEYEISGVRLFEEVAFDDADAEFLYDLETNSKQMKVSNEGTYLSNIIKEVN